MKSLEDANETLYEIKGDQLALDVVMAALTQVMEPDVRERWLKSLDASAEFAATVLMNTAVSEVTIDAYTREVARWRQLLAKQQLLAAMTAAETPIG